MRTELCNLLDQLVIKFDENTSVEIVLSALALTRLISKAENQLINSKILSADKFKATFDILKGKDENIVFDELQKICQKNNWPDLSKQIMHGAIQSLDSASSITVSNHQTYTWVKTVRENLSAYLQHDVEFVIKYWDKFGAAKSELWNNFYNMNIEIKDTDNNKLTNIDSFEKLFENRKFKRIIISAPAGYGKSTFVHELVRQWVNESNWDSKFKLVFLLRLGEIKKDTNEKFSMADLFKRCLNTTDTTMMLSILEDHKFCSEILFVFDGFDEMKENQISSQFLDIILGRERLQPFVVVTSRPECLDKIRGSACNLYIHLNGFTKKGINEQMLRFGLPGLSGHAGRGILKVPLFCTLIGILQLKTDFRNVNLCQLIDQTVYYLIERYQLLHPEFFKSDKAKLFCMLGRVAIGDQTEYSMSYTTIFLETFKNITARRRIVDNFIYVAVRADLIMANSSYRDVYFPHLLFAEYFGAFYLFNNANLKVKGIDGNYIDYINFKDNNSCKISSWLVYFLSYFDKQFKSDVWNLLPATHCCIIYLPRFDEFDSLPPISVAANILHFPPDLPASLASSLSSKLTVSSKIDICFVRLENGFAFSNMSSITHIKFSVCKLNIASVEPLNTFSNVTSMTFRHCNILCRNEDATEDNAPQLQNTSLKEVNIEFCKGDQEVFFSTLLKLCKVIETVVIDSDIEFLRRANFINFNPNVKINFKLERRSDPYQSFTDYTSLQTFIQDYGGPDVYFKLTGTKVL